MAEKDILDFQYSKLVEMSSGERVLKINRKCGAGLFSNFTTLLWDLFVCRKKGYVVHRLSSGIGAECYKDTYSDDPISELFCQKSNSNNSNFFKLPVVDWFDHHGTYSDLPFEKIKPYLEQFFYPSQSVINTVDQLVKDHCIDFKNTSTICYRGTDKIVEMPRIPYDRFIHEIESSVNDINEMRVLIQTDEQEARDFLVNHFKENSFYFHCMPVISGVNGPLAIHRHQFSGKKQFAILLYAVNLIISNTKHVVTHTGNMALWQYILRGSARNIIQLR